MLYEYQVPSTKLAIAIALLQIYILQGAKIGKGKQFLTTIIGPAGPILAAKVVWGTNLVIL